MATVVNSAVTSGHDVRLPDPKSIQQGTQNGSSDAAAGKAPDTRAQKARSKYRHIAAYHSQIRHSCLSRESDVTPSFVGFRNLMVIVLIVMNLRLIIENFMKYGVLICIRCHDYRKQDLILGAILFALVPCHLFVAYIIELAAAQQVKGAVGRLKKDRSAEENEREQKAFQSTWRLAAFAHTINATLCLVVTNFVVYYYIHHPGIGTLCELHAIIVWLKNCSYAFTNRDLRHALLNPSAKAMLPEIYSSCPYPQNITVGNLTYFWLAPTLVYQPVYPRTSHIRWSFVAKRVAELLGLSVFIWLLSAQYAAPVLRNSLDKIAVLDFASILERVMKLSTISLVIWLAGFFALFQSGLNALAEVMRFGDRDFYSDWWNSPSVGVAFAGMMFQVPLITVTLPLEKMNDPLSKIVGNSIFWVSFCLVGQPLGALLYFFAWQAKYGSVSKMPTI
ncbi:hypothetical protein Plec18170_001580 [Paecilomyces lecythidis]